MERYKNLVSHHPEYQLAMNRIGQVEALLISLEIAAQDLSEADIEACISGIRHLASSVFVALGAVREFEANANEAVK